ncbi:MAG: NAD(P)-dependent oxidoreductase [Phormidesmis sp.]
MKILITGATGAIGTKLCEYLRKLNHQVIPVGLTPRENIISADLRDEATVIQLFKSYKPDLLIHLAALTNIRFCEQNKAASWAMNYSITELLTQACLKHKTRILFFSSDYVFGKYNYLWKESDTPCPVNQYGKDKAAAEQLIKINLSDYAIIRTAQLYGVPGDLVGLVQKTLASQKEFTAFANLINCPTWIGDLFEMLKIIIHQEHQGIFHCVGPEAVSRYQYACEIAKALALEPSRIKALKLDFSDDIRPPIVRLSGTSTYERLQFRAGKLENILPTYCSSLRQEV